MKSGLKWSVASSLKSLLHKNGGKNSQFEFVGTYSLIVMHEMKMKVNKQEKAHHRSIKTTKMAPCPNQLKVGQLIFWGSLEPKLIFETSKVRDNSEFRFFWLKLIFWGKFLKYGFEILSCIVRNETDKMRYIVVQTRTGVTHKLLLSNTDTYWYILPNSIWFPATNYFWKYSFIHLIKFITEIQFESVYLDNFGICYENVV